MTQVVRAGSGSRARALDRPVAGKTGTTNEGNSAWFAGYTPQIAAAVGLYRFDANRQPISLDGIGGAGGVTGGNYPARIWTAFMQGAMDGLPVQEFPDRANVGRALNQAPTGSPRPSRSPSLAPSAAPSAGAEPTANSTRTEAPSEQPPQGPSAEPPLEPPLEPPQEQSEPAQSPVPTQGAATTEPAR
jgi:membrane peptidoglycan carboxypeptidase